MEGKKIVILGPVHPYKGGIAHYTSLLYRQMSKRNHVRMISYRLQYPKFLYPGGEQKEDKDDAFRIAGTRFLLNTVNPVSYLLTAREIRKLKPDLLIIQWWHPFFAPAYVSITKLLKKRVPILYICHNVLPHEVFPCSRFLTRQALGNGWCFIVQSEEDERNLCSLLKAPVYQRTVHPTYSVFRQKKLDRLEARKQLAISSQKQVLLFFGFVRKYKGLKYILQAMPEIRRQLPECELLIVGDFFGNDKEQYLTMVRRFGIDGCVRIFDGYIPDAEVETYFAASNLVVLPYESATQSGIVQIAFGFGIPVIVTNVGGLPEVVDDGKTGYVVPPFDSRELGKRVIQFFKQGKQEEFQENIQKDEGRFSWEHMEQVIEALYERSLQ